MYLSAANNCVTKYHKTFIQKIQDKQSFVIINNKKEQNDIFLVDKSTITANKPNPVYLAIT